MIDKIYKKILFYLDVNARTPMSVISRQIKISSQLAKYRYNCLVKKGVIKKAIAVVDLTQLGFIPVRCFIRYKKMSVEKEKEIIEILNRSDRISWLATLGGRWDLEILMFAKNIVQFYDVFNAFLNEYGSFVSEYNVSIALSNSYMKRGYLINKKINDSLEEYGGQPRNLKLYLINIKILELLVNNARLPITDLSSQLRISTRTARKRIKYLEENKIIQTYNLYLDTSKISYEFKKALINVNNLTSANLSRIKYFCKINPNIIYVIHCTGPWNIEMEMEVENDSVFRNIMFNFRKEFEDIIQTYEPLDVYTEHKKIYFPKIGDLSK